MLEGPDLVEASLDAGVALEEVFVEATTTRAELRALAERAASAGAAVSLVADGVLGHVLDARAPQGLCATCRPPIAGHEAATQPGTVLVACDLADPGNLGTAIRTAQASGAAGVVVVGHGVDVCNPKVLRATAGAIFRIAVAVAEDLDSVEAALRRGGRRLVAAAARDGVAPWSVPLDGAAILVGGEARGLRDDALARSDAITSIPMGDGAESLNAAVAAGVLCVEALRQRLAAGRPAVSSPTI